MNIRSIGARLTIWYTSPLQVGMSLENMYKTRYHFLLIMASVLPLGLFLS